MHSARCNVQHVAALERFHQARSCTVGGCACTRVKQRHSECTQESNNTLTATELAAAAAAKGEDGGGGAVGFRSFQAAAAADAAATAKSKRVVGTARDAFDFFQSPHSSWSENFIDGR